jgi:hypothetical protein
MNRYPEQTLIRLTVEIRNILNALVNPSAITCVVRIDGSSENISVGIVHDSVGKYHVDFLPSGLGVHEYKWLCTGTVQVSRKGRFDVSEGAF